MSTQNRLRIVASREVAADPPRLVDYHLASEAVTEELATYETLYQTVFEDRGGTRRARAERSRR